MKVLQILILVATTSLSSCTKNNEYDRPTDDSIIGQWQLIERFDGGSPEPIQNIENGEIINFKSDFSYTNSNYPCDGSYLINSSDIIEVIIPCISSENLLFTYRFDNESLLLNSYPSTCDEGCYDKYKRLNSK